MITRESTRLVNELSQCLDGVVQHRSGPDSAPTYTYELHTYQKDGRWKPNKRPAKAIGISFDLVVKLLECGHLPKGAQPRPTKQDVLGISRVTSKAPRWRVTTWESCGPRVGASCLRRGPERRACIGHRRRAHPYCVDAIAAKCCWSRLLGALLIVREGRDAIAATDACVTVSTQHRYYCRSFLSGGHWPRYP
jgi:hypothetical protein